LELELGNESIKSIKSIFGKMNCGNGGLEIVE